MKITKTLVAVIVGTGLTMGTVATSFAEEPAATTLGETIDDGVLTMKVKTALIDSPDTKALQIDVDTKEGVVRLSGAVDTALSKSAATSVAMSVKGVKEVQNDLTIKQ